MLRHDQSEFHGFGIAHSMRPPRRLYQLTSRGVEAAAALRSGDDPGTVPGVAGAPA